MKAYSVTSANVNSTFPTISGKNASTGTSTDGTPYHADYISDVWATKQALLDRVGKTPSGSVETYTAVGSGSNAGQGQTINDGAQQHIRALAANFGAPGELVFDVVNASVTDRRVVQLQGGVLDGYLYPDLVYSVWVGSGANGTATGFYTTSDAGGTTRATTGLTINGITSGRYLVLPDYRGLGPQGLGTNGKSFAANGTGFAGGAVLGAYLLDGLQGHVHANYPGSSGVLSLQPGSYTWPLSGTTAQAVSPSGTMITDGTNGTPRTGPYTKGPGFACNIGVRY